MNELERLRAEVKTLRDQLSQCHAAMGAARLCPSALDSTGAIAVALLSPLLDMCGIYFLVRAGVVVYVGQSNYTLNRIATHSRDAEKDFDSVWFMQCGQSQLDALERYWIRVLDPELNKQTYDYRPPPPPRAGDGSMQRWCLCMPSNARQRSYQLFKT